VQVISAVAALREHQSQHPQSLPDILGLQPLHTNDAQRAHHMAVTTSDCAAVLHPWEAVHDLGVAELDPSIWEPTEIFVHMLEIPEAVQLFARWPRAKRVLYGDGLGLAQTAQDFGPARSLRSEFRRRLARFLPTLRRADDDLGNTPCDFAYALAKDPDYPCRSTHLHRLSPECYRALFQQLADGMRSQALDDALDCLPMSTSCDLLLMTNLPGLPITDRGAEMQAYTDMLRTRHCPKAETLIVKPHPRNHADAVHALRDAMRSHYLHVVLLHDHATAALPFEVLLLRALADNRIHKDSLTVFSTSNAACSLPVVFGIAPVVGFGPRACRAIYQNAAWLKSRLRHERKLSGLLKELINPEIPVQGGWRAFGNT
jgi:hypothetical protein